jgi:vacuolar-type H+-ATPase subunit F/Vma7
VVAKHDLNGVDATKVFQDGKNDHQILNAALTLQRQNKDRKVVLVSKDVALRLKAKSLNIICGGLPHGQGAGRQAASCTPASPWWKSSTRRR